MPIEAEHKARVRDIDALLAALDSRATAETALYRDHYFDSADGNLTASGHELRVRSVETADADPAGLAPALRRDAAELDGFLEFLAGELTHESLDFRAVGGVFNGHLPQRELELVGIQAILDVFQASDAHRA